MGVQVAFSYATWASTFPALAAYVNPDQATGAFNIAVMFQRNDGTGPISDPTQQLTLLNLLTAHISVLMYPTTGPVQNPDPASPLVGRVDSASEGSVSVHAENNYPPGAPQWYQQTPYGSMWWTATSGFRVMRYKPSRRPLGPFGPFGFIGSRGGAAFLLN